MKIKYLGLFTLLIIFLFIIPMSFASSLDNDTLLDDNYEIENNYGDLSTEVSYFEDDNENIEEPMLDDDFANPKISYTEKNTFYVNESYEGKYEFGTISNPFKDIDSAFSSLTLNRSVVNIYIAQGTYKVSKTINLNKNLNIIGQNPLNTIIDGKNSTQIFFVNKPNLSINFVNLSFTGGNTYYGSAIYNNRSSVKLVNDIFDDNYAVGYYSTSENYSAAGAALYNEAGVYKIYNSSFINNRAESSLNVYGAAIYNELGSVSVLNSKFINNTLNNASYGSGGAIYNFNGFLTVFNSTFSNNVIDSNFSIGGAIYNYESHNVYIINSTFDSNKIYGNCTLGSAIANSASLFEVVNTNISNNLANGSAPENTTVFNINGIYNLINSTLINNTINNPKNLLMCLEDQFIISRAFDESSLLDLPSKYDLRTDGIVTYAKNQGSSGACWAFTTLAALESFLLKTENVSYDLSENNLKNLMNNGGVNGTDWGDGGNYQMALAYLLRWDGPIDEDDDTFSAYSVIPNYGLIPLKHVQGALYLPMRMGYLDNNQIKYAVMKYGALYASIYGTSMIKNVYNSVAEIPNHAVTIVGWDDNYPASKFLGTKPPANGAFIIKNSWGTSYGDKGFGYVSYYDKTFAGFSLDSLSAMAFTDVENTTNYKDIYQYDILGNTYESLGFASDVAWMANQFQAVSNNPLSAFGFYTYGTSEFLADIYVNGELKYSQEGEVGYAGYHTIKLNELINLVKGDTFRINLKLNTPDSKFPISIESARNGYSSKATASLNQSFISSDGINWIDIAQDLEMLKISGCFYNKTLEQSNVCLKAYTANSGDLQLNVTSEGAYFYKDGEITFSLNLTNVGDFVRNINVTISLDEITNLVSYNLTKGNFNDGIWMIDELDNNKSAILNLTVKILEIKDSIQNNAIITCLDLINNNDEKIEFNLSYAGFTRFIVENITALSKSNENINITLIDLLSNPVSNEKVVVNFDNGENITVTSDENGIININLDLSEGTHIANVYFEGSEIHHPSNATFNVNVSKRNSKLVNTNQTVLYYPEVISVLLADENDTVLNNRSISFNIGDETVNVTTCNGYANLSDLKAGNYSMHCSFSGDELYYASSCEFNISVIKKNTTLTSGNLTTTSVVIKVDGKVGKYLKVTLMSGNLTLSSKDVQIKINSKTYNVKTDESGIAYLQINLAKARTYSAEIAFLGDNEYNSSFAVSKITVKKKKMSLKVPKKTYKKSKKVKKLTATLKDNKSKAISSKKIIFKVNGKKYTAKTNKKGVANVKVKITKKKKYTVTVTFKGDSSYAKIVKKSKLIIK